MQEARLCYIRGERFVYTLDSFIHRINHQAEQNYLGYPVDIAIQPLDIRGLVDVSINDDTTKITR